MRHVETVDDDTMVGKVWWRVDKCAGAGVVCYLVVAIRRCLDVGCRDAVADVVVVVDVDTSFITCQQERT